jgi:flagellar hook-length control protein FliK
MFNLVDNRLEGDGQSATAPSLKHMPDLSGSSLTDKVNLGSEEWGQLDSILTTLVEGILQNEYLPLDTQVNNTLTSETTPAFVMTGNHLQQITDEDSKDLAEWLHRVDGSIQTSTMDQVQLVEELARVISEFQLQKGHNVVEIPAQIEEKLQMILSEKYTENDLSGNPFLFSNLTANNLVMNDRMTSAGLDLGIQKGKVPISAQVNENIQISNLGNGIPFNVSKTVNEWIKKMDGLNLNSSHDFTVLVQELISRLQSLDLQNPIVASSENRPENPMLLMDSLLENKLVAKQSFNDPNREGEFSTSGINNMDRDAVNSSLTKVEAHQLILQSNSEISTLLQEAQISAKVNDFLQKPLEIPVISSLPQNAAEVIKTVTNWYQRVKRLNQNEVLEPNKLVEELTKLIEELQTKVGMKPAAEFDVSVPSVSNDKNKEKDLIQSQSFITPRREDELFFRGKGLEPRDVPLSNPNLIPDDKLVSLPIQPKITTHPLDGAVLNNGQVNDVVQLPTSVKMNIPIQQISTEGINKVDHLLQKVEEETSTEQPIVGTNQLKGSDTLVISKAIPAPPVLTFTSFVPEVSEWMGRFMKISNNPLGSTEARFSLYPEHLGHVEIKISTQEGQVSAQIITDTSLAKETLEGQLHQLRQALQQLGINVQKLEVVQQLPVSLDSNQGNPSFSQSGSSSSNDQRTTNSGKGESKKDKDEDEVEVGREVLPAPYGQPTSKIASRIDFTA